jgi:predicted permease
MFRRIKNRLILAFRGARHRKELDEEMAFHIQCLTEDLIQEGMSPKEAYREAIIRFGNREGVQSRTREVQGMALLDETNRNLRFALRGLARSPVFTSTFILTLALCIGLGAAVFSVVDAVLWRPLPYPNPEKLAHAVLFDPAFGKTPDNFSVDGRAWERIRDEGEMVDRAVYSAWIQGVNLSTDATSAFVGQQRVGAGYFSTIGVPPQQGREFLDNEDAPGGPPVAILSHELWRRTFNGNPEILGSTIRVKGETHTVVGILPPEFSSAAEAQIWTPLRASTRGEGGGTNYAVLVRVPSEMTMEEADARLASIEPPVSTRADAPDYRFGLVPFDESQTAGLRLPLLILMGAIGLMLVVGCANLASLQIARSLTRRGEMATRQALGSGTGALVRQMMAENLLLGFLGGLVGMAVCFWAMEGLEALTRAHFGTWQEVRLDARVMSSVLALTALATVLFGLAPVLQARKPGANRVLLSGSRGVLGKGAHLARKALLVGEVTMVATLLFAAGLLVRSYGHISGMEPGFDSRGVLTLQLSLDDARYAEAEKIRELFRDSQTRLESIPGVASASVALTLPYERPLNLPFTLPGDGEQNQRITNVVYVTPGFFETLDIPLLQGRAIQEGDRGGTPYVAVANQAFVEEHIQDQSALGIPVSMGFGGEEGVQIEGVVGNVLQRAGWGVDRTPVWETPTLYLAAAQASDGFMRQVHVWFSPSWIIKGNASQSDLAAQVTKAFRVVDADLPVARLAELQEVMDQAFARERFEAAFLLAVAGFALLLAGIGLYGIVAHEALERRAEMGLRMALGATPAKAVWTTGMSGVTLTILGLALGSVVFMPVGRLMGGLIYGVTPFDPWTMLFLLGILALFSALASFIPAVKIGKTDPGEILKGG